MYSYTDPNTGEDIVPLVLGRRYGAPILTTMSKNCSSSHVHYEAPEPHTLNHTSAPHTYTHTHTHTHTHPKHTLPHRVSLSHTHTQIQTHTIRPIFILPLD